MNETFDAARTLETVRQLQQQLKALQQTQGGPIAVRGMAMRLPGGVSCADTLWGLVSQDQDAFGPTPTTRWTHEELEGVPNAGAFLNEEALSFDRGFWNLSPAEAQAMDPQQRLALTLAWEAIQDATVAPHTLAGQDVGVYFGCTGSDFAVIQRRGQHPLGPYSGTGLAGSMLANRVSHRLDLRGPSLTIDAACASSLLALQLAVEHLRNKTCSWALVGGVSLMLDPGPTQIFAQSGVLSSSGRCRPFDEEADGFLRGEGAVVLLLQRLEDAQAQGASVRGVIEGVASSQDGRTTSLTLPSARAHEQAARDALHDAGREPHEVGLIEVHAAGAPVADPIEAHAMGNVYARKDGVGFVGSIKGHIGHTEGACGLISLAKVLAALEHQQIPPQANLTTPSPHLGFQEARLSIPRKRQPWPQTSKLAAVHSYGYGGTNVHAIVRGPESRTVTRPDQTPLWLDISGADPASIMATARELHALLVACEAPGDLCWSWNLRQSPLRYRSLVCGADKDALLRALSALSNDAIYATNDLKTSEHLTTLEGIEQRHSDGHHLDWLAAYQGLTGPEQTLPRYAWQGGIDVVALPASAPSSHVVRLPSPEPNEPLNIWLCRLCAALLGFQDPVDPDTPLAEHGFDSIGAVRLVRSLAENGFDLPLHLLTTGPSPNTIAQHITSLTAEDHVHEAPLRGGLLSHATALCLGAAIVLGMSYLADRMLPDDGAWIRTPDVAAEPARE